MTRVDRLALLASLAVAAWLRLPGIEARGRFDADQGHDMLTLLRFTQDGLIPLLGPKTSAGDFHHGAFYYYLLAPSAAISGSDPVVVTAFIALLGIGAAGLTWWLGRAIGGPMAGAIAGPLMAVSPAGIEESTFVWNPNPIAFFAALAFVAAWRARSGGRNAWWAVAMVAAGMVMQLHILGAIFLLEVLWIAVLEVRRNRAMAGPLVVGLAGAALLFVPLLAYELGTGFAETRGVLAYFAGGGDGDSNPLVAVPFTLFRVVAWPFVGSVHDAAPIAAVLLALVIGGAVLAYRLVTEERRTAVRWFIGLAIWSTLALAIAAPSLLTIVIGLPNDHYHAFLDPVVILLVAIPAGILFERALAAWRSTRRPASALAAGVVALLVVAVFTTEILRRPPKVDPDGGWPAMRDAGARIADVADGRTVFAFSVPDFKLPDAVAFPVIYAGGRVGGPELRSLPAAPPGILVVVCDRLFEHVVGATCGGPAEDAYLARLFGGIWADTPLVDRFPASPRTHISIYAPSGSSTP